LVRRYGEIVAIHRPEIAQEKRKDRLIRDGPAVTQTVTPIEREESLMLFVGLPF
jgi:hypothetical protein